MAIIDEMHTAVDDSTQIDIYIYIDGPLRTGVSKNDGMSSQGNVAMVMIMIGFSYW